MSPETTPLGGMQSGICYLSRSLSRRGHDVALYNNYSDSGVFDGVNCHNIDTYLHLRQFQDCDVYVSISCEGRYLRSIIGRKPLVLFTGHNADVPIIKKLSDPLERNCWDAFIFKTNWQAHSFELEFNIDKSNVHVITNAASYFFHAPAGREHYFFEQAGAPILYFSSTPFRGLELLLYAFPLMRVSLPQVRARIFSSMAVYRRFGKQDQYSALYRACSHVGMEYVGSINQQQLAQAVSSTDILAFPSTYAETSCITIMEAMLNCSIIVTHDLGALRETAAGFGHFLAYNPGDDKATLARRFADFLVSVVAWYRRNPIAGRHYLESQRLYALRNYSWEKKAEEWEEFLKGLVAR